MAHALMPEPSCGHGGALMADDVFWSCSACGGTWFRIRKEVRLPAQGYVSRAPGAEPIVVETRVAVTCTECGQDV